MTVEKIFLFTFPIWVVVFIAIAMYKKHKRWVLKTRHEKAKTLLSEKVKRGAKVEVEPKEQDAIFFMLGKGHFYAVYDKKLERIIIKFKFLKENTTYSIEVLSEKNFDKMYKEVG